jgi:peptidoglycan/LPS O-acetylase OafA/YrhL
MNNLSSKNIEYILTLYIDFIIFIKILFIICVFGDYFFRYYNKDSKSSIFWEDMSHYWRLKTEFIFTICTALLLIFIFRGKTNIIYITDEMRILFYLFGFLLIVTADWSSFFKVPKADKKLSESLN